MNWMQDQNFCRIIPILLALEGGYVNDPNDPGGETNMGISKRSYPSLDIPNLTFEQAANVYYIDYWLKGNCDTIPAPLAFFHFDTCVNQGLLAANKILQQSVGAVEDGVIGPATTTAVKNMPRTQYYIYLVNRLAHYKTLQGWSTYGAGWMNRLLRLAGSLS
jgi:lysozyme family protein